MPSRPRSCLISSIIAATVFCLNGSSHSLSGASTNFAPYSAARMAPTGFRYSPGIIALPECRRCFRRASPGNAGVRSGRAYRPATRIVDIIFLGDAETRRLEQPRQRIADHRAAAMAHVHRPGRVGRDIFDVDPFVVADVRQAVALALAEDRRQLVAPAVLAEPDVDEPRPGDLDRVTPGSASSFGTISAASARGLVPAPFASTIAALVARSPCEGSRGGSTATDLRLASAGRAPSLTRSSRMPSSSAE